MTIDEAFQRKGDGKLLVTGKVSAGEVRAGDRLLVQSPSGVFPVVVEELFGFSSINAFLEGDNAAVVLRDVTLAEIPAGSRLTGGG